MDVHIKELATRIIGELQRKPEGERVLVAVAGVPGSGKSTLAYPLVDEVNRQLGVPVEDPAEVDEVLGVVEGEDSVGKEGARGKRVAVAVGLDGWHHTRDELDRFPDPAEARRRRGAAFTFDAPAYTTFVRALRTSPPPPSIPFPTFDHRLKDPQPSPFAIKPHHRVVVIEGLYTMLDEEGWREAAGEMDERVWVECEPEVARARLVGRHLESGVETERGAAERRVDGSDMLNGESIRAHLFAPTVTVASVEDPAFVAMVTGA